MVIHINYLLILLSLILSKRIASFFIIYSHRATSCVESSRCSQRGLGMIEILVTLVILAIGLLGVATLQLIASFNHADALSRSQAVLVAEQVSERLRVSAITAPDADGKIIDDAYVNSNLYNFANLSCTSSSSDYACFCETFPATLPNCHSSQCTSEQVAAFDAYQLSCASIQHNPNMRIAVTCVDTNTTDSTACSSGSRHTILLSWPVAHWGNKSIRNPACNPESTDDNDCIIVEVFL